MNNKSILLFIMCSFLFFGCKNDTSKKDNDLKKKASQSENLKEEKSNIFSVQLNLQVQKDDALEVFYLENESDTYVSENMIQEKIIGGDDFQKIRFEFPKDIYPSNIRLDFGFNQDQDPIKISDCTLSYNNNSFVIKGSELKNYFMFNGGVEILSDSITFKLKPFNLHGKEVHDPYIVGNKNLEMALMTKI